VAIRPGDFDLDRLPRHLRLRFTVEDAAGRVLASGRDLDALAAGLGDRARQAVAAVTPGHLERSGLTAWPPGGLPRTVTTTVDGRPVVAYPTLVDEGSTVAVRIVTTEAEQARLMWAGTRRLLILTAPRAIPQAEARLREAPTRPSTSPAGGGGRARSLADLATAMSSSSGRGGGRRDRGSRSVPGVEALAVDCVVAAADRLVGARGGVTWDEAGWERLEEAARERLGPLAVAAAGQAGDLVVAAAALGERLDQLASVRPDAVADARAQLARLVFPGFVTAAGLGRLQDVARYVEGIRVRLDKLRERPDRDRELMARARAVEVAYDEVVAGLPAHRRGDPEVADIGWLLEELRVSLFAQALGTARPVSEQRLHKALAALR
jgi:ATP-dependent helicase HrpA